MFLGNLIFFPAMLYKEIYIRVATPIATTTPVNIIESLQVSYNK